MNEFPKMHKMNSVVKGKKIWMKPKMESLMDSCQLDWAV